VADQLDILIKTQADINGIRVATQELTKLQKAANETQKNTQDTLSTISKTASNLPISFGKLGLGIAIAGKAFSELSDLISDSINEALQAEKALNDLTVSLEGTNEATKENIDSFKAFASQIQSTTRFGDDLVIKQLAVAKSFGLTNDEAKKLVETATDLAATTGRDLNTSVDDLLKSLTGQLPRELKLLGREFANLTDEQLKAGAAIDLIQKKFGSRAEKDINTLTGAYEQFKNTLSDAKEEIGKIVLETGFLQGALAKATSGIKIFADLESDTEKLSRFRQELDSADGAIRRLVLEKKIVEIEAKIKSEALEQTNKDIDDAIKFAKNREINIVFSVDQGAKQKFIDELKKVGLNTTEIAKKERDERLKKLNDIFGNEQNISRLSLDDKKIVSDLKLRIEKDYNNKVREESSKTQKKTEEDARKALQTFNEAKNNIAKGFVEFVRTKDKNSLFGALSGIGGAVTQGAGGARSLLGQGAQFAGFALGGTTGEAIGSAVGPILQELSKGKEAARAFVTEFTNAIPDMVLGLTEGIIEAAQVLIEKMPEVVDKLVQNAPKIISAIVEGVPKITAEFQAQMPTVAVTFASSLVEQAPAIAQAIVKSIANTPGNAAKSVGRIFRFAEGGQAFVKSVTGGLAGQDSVPAALMPGELVVDRSTAFKLKNLLDGKQSLKSESKSEETNMNLIEALINRPIIVNIDGREVARATRNQVRSGFVLA